MSSKLNKRILLISHGHPDLKKGGAEVASYNMFKELEVRGEDVYYLAHCPQVPHGGTSFSARNSAKEILFHTNIEDGFLVSNFASRALWKEFRDLLVLLNPEVVHLHHYLSLGIEILEVIRNTLPNAKIILTLHEYLAICHNKGLMVKSNGALCYRSSSRDCSNCFPEKSPADFFLREKYIKRLFVNIDKFISPSHFLKSRYVDWGLEDSKISVIENTVNSSEMNITNNKGDDYLTRFAFFGQINPHKGIEVLLEAVQLLPNKVKKRVAFDIYGANLSEQSVIFQERFKDAIDSLKDTVFFHGSYEQVRMPKILSKVDWVVVPSTWWENSPMVIQEAFKQRVPVIVSDIGGLAEKVKHGIDGLQFDARNAVDLAQTITFSLSKHVDHAYFVGNIQSSGDASDIVDQHIPHYS